MPNLFEQVTPSVEGAKQIINNNFLARRMFEVLDLMPDSREKSLAITKLEECVMWANKCAARKM